MDLATGADAAAKVAQVLADVVCLQHLLDDAAAKRLGEDVFISSKAVQMLERSEATGSSLKNSPVSGGVTAVLTGSQMLVRMLPNLYNLEAPVVIHVATMSPSKKAGREESIESDLSDLMAIRETDATIFFAASVQEVFNHGILAHALASSSDSLVVNAWDGTRLTNGLAQISGMNETAELQKMVASALSESLDKALNIFGYTFFEYEGRDDAEFVFVALGATALSFRSLVREKDSNVGVLRVRVLRPWSASHFMAALPRSTRKICVIDQNSNQETPLFKDVIASFHADAQWSTPFVASANVVVPSSSGFTLAIAKELLTNLMAEQPKQRITLEGLENIDVLATEDSGKVELTHQVVTWALHTGEEENFARSSLAAILGRVLGFKVQTHSQSSTETAMTRSELRFGPMEITAEHCILGADVIVCEDPSVLLLPHCDVLAQAKSFGTKFLLNCPWKNLDRVEKELSDTVKIIVANKGVELFVVDAGSDASRISWMMQALAVSLLPKVDYRQFYTHTSRVIRNRANSETAESIVPLLATEQVSHVLHRIDVPLEKWRNLRSETKEVAPLDVVPLDMRPTGLIASRSDAKVFDEASPSVSACMKLMSQIFGQRLITSEATRSDATVAESVEASYGSFLAKLQARKRLVDFVGAALSDSSLGSTASKDLLATLGMWHASYDHSRRCSRIVPRLTALLEQEQAKHPSLKHIFEERNLLEKESKWIIGGDSWAYDVSSNGIHHILKAGQNVNVIIFDCDGYSSEATARNAERTLSGISMVTAMSTVPREPQDEESSEDEQKTQNPPKKDIGLYAMNYGTAYVASISALANHSQALRALAEADEFDGPSIILAHTPKATGEGLPLSRVAASAVDSGAWPLYRWNPNRSDDEFTLDSSKLQAGIEEFLKREQQLSILTNALPHANPVDEDDLGSKFSAKHESLKKEAEQRRLNDQYDSLVTAVGGNKSLNLLVLYGSDGGNGSFVAEKLAKKAEVNGCGEVRCMEANDFTVDDLPEEKNVVLVLSTAGQGEPCANAKTFFEALNETNAKLNGLRYAVFGLGDSHYWGEGSADSAKYFCLNARETDSKLAALGAERIVRVGLGDDQNDDGYEGELNEWEPTLWDALDVTIDTTKDLGGPPPIIDDDIKKSSNFLAGNIDEGLRDTSTGKLLPEDTKLTKFHGIYQQDLRSVREERIANKQELAYSFMIRIGLPGGVATAEQYLAMDEIITKYSGNQVLKATTRQAYQIHGVIKTNMKDTMKAINRAAMDTLAACGDVNRNVIGDQNKRKSPAHAKFNEIARKLQAHLRPVAGGHTYASIWLEKEIVAGTVLEEPIYGETYLPRKFKIALAVNGERNLVDVFAHCLGIIANIENDRLVDLTITVGGGMGTTFGNKATYPRLADVLGACKVDQVLEVAEAIVKVQRDHGERVNRKHARLKYTVEDMGLEVFRAKVEELCEFELGEAKPIKFTANTDGYGWHQGYEGLWDYTMFVENGRILDTADYKLRTGLREIAKANVNGEISLTATQNVVIGAVPESLKPRIQELLDKYNINNNRWSGIRKASMACVALPTCALAMAEAQRYLPSLIDKIDDILDECGLRSDSIVIRCSGCPNGCSRPYIAEIALVGTAPGKYHLLLGGGHAGNRIARLYKQGIDEEEILRTLRPMFEGYAKKRLDGEHFGDFVIRQKIVEPVLHGRCFWVTNPSENDTSTLSGTTQIYW